METFSYVKPLCDETCFSSARPICASLSEAWGLRHSLSNSCICVSAWALDRACGASAVALGANKPYLDVKVLVDLDGVAEEADVLREVGKLPHVPELLQRTGLLDRRLGLHLVAGALPGGHLQERAWGDASGQRLGGWADLSQQ